MISKEWSLVVFTLAVQAAVGLLVVGFCAGWYGLLYGDGPDPGATSLTLQVAALLLLSGVGAANLHLGSSKNAWQALRNIRTSWLSREIALTGFLTALVSLSALGIVLDDVSMDLALMVNGIAALLGVFAVLAMSRVYMLRTVPLWNHWTTAADFFSAALLLGLAAYASVLFWTLSPGGNGVDRIALIMGLLISCAAGARLIAVQQTALRKVAAAGYMQSCSMIIRAVFLSCGLALLFAAPLLHHIGVFPAATLLIAASEIKGRMEFYESFKTVGL